MLGLLYFSAFRRIFDKKTIMSFLVLLFGVSGGEILLIFLVALLLFGSKGLPDVAKGLGKGLKELQKATDEIKREINNSTSGAMDEINKIRNDITGNLTNSLSGINDTMSSLRDPLSGINETVNSMNQPFSNLNANVSAENQPVQPTQPVQPAQPENHEELYAPYANLEGQAVNVTQTSINLRDSHEVLQNPFKESPSAEPAVSVDHTETPASGAIPSGENQS